MDGLREELHNMVALTEELDDSRVDGMVAALGMRVESFALPTGWLGAVADGRVGLNKALSAEERRAVMLLALNRQASGGAPMFLFSNGIATAERVYPVYVRAAHTTIVY